MTIAVDVRVHADKPTGPYKPLWNWFGYDEPNYTYSEHGKKLLKELTALSPSPPYIRTHNLLTSGDGVPALKWGSTNAYTEDAQGRPVYDWTIVDRIFDTYRARGVKPYVEIGFMPQALSTAPQPYQHDFRPGSGALRTGWAYPPKDYAKWAELVYQWTLHNVQRYGRAEVDRWYFEVWNEANLPLYWKGTPDEFYKMHDYAIDAVRRALPTARVGGPDVAGSARPDRDSSFHTFMEGFLAHVTRGKNYVTGKTGTPTHFLSFHAKGAPTFVDGHVRMGISTHLKAVDNGFIKVAAVPELAKKPIVIGESDPEGCAACPGPQNAYRNGTMYSSYTAASFARIWEMAHRRNVNLEGVLTWAFTFENQPWFAGYRQLATNGIDLPVMNVFRLFSKLGSSQIVSTSSAEVPLDKIIADGVREAPDVSAIATRDSNGQLAILVWNYHDDDVAGPDAAIRLSLKGIGSGNRTVTVWRVDPSNANAFAAWKKMGSPQSLDANQYKQLEAASKLLPEPARTLAVNKGSAEFSINVPRQGVLLLTMDK